VEQTTFVKVAETSEIPSGQMKAVKIEEKEILIANVNGTYYAIGNICTHKEGDLSKGMLSGTIVTCSKHNAKFDVTTGKVITHPKVGFFHPKVADEPSYPVKVENGSIMVNL
jgi:3-phenylpropionate/trans-cinnamate dioxygenase ferredoxin subunit